MTPMGKRVHTDNVSELRIRNVPPAVAANLKAMAALEQTSLNSFLLGRLTKLAATLPVKVQK